MFLQLPGGRFSVIVDTWSAPPTPSDAFELVRRRFRYPFTSQLEGVTERDLVWRKFAGWRIKTWPEAVGHTMQLRHRNGITRIDAYLAGNSLYTLVVNSQPLDAARFIDSFEPVNP